MDQLTEKETAAKQPSPKAMRLARTLFFVNLLPAVFCVCWLILALMMFGYPGSPFVNMLILLLAPVCEVIWYFQAYYLKYAHSKTAWISGISICGVFCLAVIMVSLAPGSNASIFLAYPMVLLIVSIKGLRAARQE